MTGSLFMLPVFFQFSFSGRILSGPCFSSSVFRQDSFQFLFYWFSLA